MVRPTDATLKAELWNRVPTRQLKNDEEEHQE